MAEKQILSLKPAPRLEQVGDEHSKRVQDRKHRTHAMILPYDAMRIQAGWNFRKGQPADA
jgi:hypothetical protein